jgi:hypothetical protein
VVTGIKFKRSEVTDLGEEKNEEPVTSQVIKTEPNLSCVSCC